MLQTALALAARGLHVFPCRPRDKRPATTDGLKSATVDAGAIEQWWRSNPDFNIAVATGTISGVFVVDVDGVDAATELQKLEREHGELPTTIVVATARGRHLYFQAPEMPVRSSAGKIAKGLDTRGDGGYVLVPPSIHPSGHRYCRSADSANVPAAAPAWLLNKITTPANGNGVMTATPVADWRALVRDGVGEGARDCTVAKLAGYLLRRRIDPIIVLGLVQAWNATSCTPPLPTADIERIVNSIAGRELARRNGGNGG
jgi:Bifunctional DNA primase/polymerase, N-terminal/Primase C terminal 1 (PriCT-1)